MAATDSSSNSLSPRTSGLSGDGSHRNSSNLSSPTPWAHIVRPESEVIQASPSSPQPVNSDFSSSAVKPASSSLSSDDSALQTSGNDNGNVSSAKKPPPPPPPAWNKPANGTIEAGPVMGAVSWPALSESSRALPKSFVDTGKSVSTQQGPLIASSPDKQANTNANPNSTPNHALPVRQKSMKRGSGGGGGGGGPANAHAAFSHPPSTLEMPRNNSSNLGATALHSSPGDHTNKSQNWDGESRGGFSPRTHIASDHPHSHSHSHPHPRGFSFRRGNGGPHPIPRGDASFPNNYAGRREHDRATNHEWNPRRNFNGSRDAHLQQQHQQQHGVFPRSFMRHPPPGAGPFIGPPPPPPPPPGRPFGNPIGFHDMSMTTPVYYVQALPHDPLGVVPFIPVTPPPIFFPAPDPQLRASLLKQIDYYFSPENLCKDIFLRQKMDDQGWVPVSLIATFNRVRLLTNNTQIILDAVRTSTVVEVKGDKIRRRNDWMTWLLLPSNQSTSVSAPESPRIPNSDILANHVQNVKLEEEGKVTNQDVKPPANPLTGAVPSRLSSLESNSLSQTSNREETGQTVVRAGSDQAMSTRSSGDN